MAGDHGGGELARVVSSHFTSFAPAGVAVATASVRVGHVALRAGIQRLDDRIEAQAVFAEASRERYQAATRPEELLRMWRELEAVFAEARRS